MSNSAFANLKKSSKKGTFEALSQKMNDKKSYDDNSHEFWKLKVGGDGNGYAVIRFLPASEGEETPVVKIFKHSFKGPGGWFIQNDPSTIGQKSYVYEATQHLWKSNDPSDVAIARERKRQTKYIANILVVEDSAAPENQGKVFKYEFGPAIFGMLDAAMVGDEVEGVEGFNPFDFWEGAHFKLRAHNKAGGQRSYEKSKFAPQSALFDGDDEKLEKLYKTQYKLQDEIAESKFKSYDELKRIYQQKTGEVDTSPTRSPVESKYDEDFDFNKSTTPAVKRQSQVAKPKDDDDDDLSQYASLLNDD